MQSRSQYFTASLMGSVIHHWLCCELLSGCLRMMFYGQQLLTLQKRRKKKYQQHLFFFSPPTLHSLLGPEMKTGNLWRINTCRNVFCVHVCAEGKQQRCLAAGWGMRENRKCDLGNNIWIRRRDSQSNGCFGLCNWNIDSLTAPFVKGLVHPNYRETFFSCNSSCICTDSLGFIFPDFWDIRLWK